MNPRWRYDHELNRWNCYWPLQGMDSWTPIVPGWEMVFLVDMNTNASPSRMMQ